MNNNHLHFLLFNLDNTKEQNKNKLNRLDMEILNILIENINCNNLIPNLKGKKEHKIKEYCFRGFEQNKAS